MFHRSFIHFSLADMLFFNDITRICQPDSCTLYIIYNEFLNSPSKMPSKALCTYFNVSFFDLYAHLVAVRLVFILVILLVLQLSSVSNVHNVPVSFVLLF